MRGFWTIWVNPVGRLFSSEEGWDGGYWIVWGFYYVVPVVDGRGSISRRSYVYDVASLQVGGCRAGICASSRGSDF